MYRLGYMARIQMPVIPDRPPYWIPLFDDEALALRLEMFEAQCDRRRATYSLNGLRWKAAS